MRRLSALTVLSLTLLSGSASAAVTGLVINPDGAAIADARVQAYWPESSSERRERLLSGKAREPLASVTTDAKGAFSIDFKVPVAELTFERAGHAPTTLRSTPAEDLGTVVLRPAALRSGSVRAAGKPVSDAVVVLDDGIGSELLLRTSDTGEFTVPDPDVWAEKVLVIHPDFARVENRRRFQRKLPIDLQLSRGRQHEGLVVSADGKTPVAGARILVDGWPAGISAQDGTFAIQHLPDGWSEIRAVKEDQIASRTRSSAAAPALRLGRASTVSGVVTDATGGTPIAGARVYLGRDRESQEWALTDGKGRFLFSSLPAGSYWLVTAMPGFSDSRVETPAGAGAAESRSVLLARTGSIEGEVLDENGKAVAGASVEANPNPTLSFRPPMRGDPHGVSGPDGRFVVRNVPPRDATALDASRKGFAETRKSGVKVTAGQRTRGVRVTLASGFELAGRVSDRDGRGIAGATIEATKSELGIRSMRFFMFDPNAPALPATSSDGNFSMRLAEGSYDLAIRREGFAPKRLTAVRVGRDSEPLEVILEEGVTLAGRVVTASGAPVGEANLTLSTMDTGPQGTAVSAPDGSFAIEDLAPGKMTIHVQKLDSFVMFSQPVTVPDAQVIVELPAGGNVSGRVLDKATKRPVTTFSAGLSGVRSSGQTTRMGPPMMKEFRSDDGTFLLENLPVGQHQIQVTAPGYVSEILSGVKIEEGTPVEDLEVSLEAGVRVVGKVTGPDGAAIAGAHINYEPPGNEPRFSRRTPPQTTDANGEYILESVPAGEQTLRVGKQGYVTEQKNVKVSGVETRVDVRLEKGNELTGTVVDSSGQPVAEATVSAQSSTSGNRATTDGNGAFTLDGLAPGRYTVRAMKTGFAAADVKDVDAASSAPLRLVLESGGTVYGRVTGHDESKTVFVRAYNSQGSALGSVDAEGNYRIEGSPVGTVTVMAAYRASVGPSKQIEVASGLTYAVDLEFRDDVVVSGRVFRHGRPVGLSSVSFNPVDARIRTRGTVPTDADGAYSISGLEPSEYEVRVMEQNTMQPYETRYRVTGSANFDIEIRGATLRGRVVDADSGEPIADVPITVSNEGSSSTPRTFPSTASGWDGNFAIENLTAGNYQLRAQKNGWGHQIQNVSLGEGFTEDVVFRLTKNDGMVLRVIDGRDGRSLNAVVLVSDASNRIVYQGPGIRAADGSMRVSVAPGTYRVTVSSGGYAARTINAAVPGESSVGLTPGGTLVLVIPGSERVLARMLLPSGEPYRRSAWNASPDFPLSPGSTPLTHILPGSYTVMIVDEKGQPAKSQTVNVVEGQTATVKF